ncbi:hypothetical protein LTR70_007460 [Exophiala xenobiotica]|uniref:Epoxide hydrolase N-terminal domain-containing protein n=1 Tax=Lithohypha guttulata TaxID=1690604 RepID=A0ABR0KQC6_9EURO|nr:hypothetical protein LTR24_000381 [Lithohypha guttulata]KAK5313691.1 hypothetical protein LTR70_007460 [Exophiala xenobiotica]
MADVRPYEINVPEEKIARLKQKLAMVDLPPEVEGVTPWDRGVPLADAKRILEHWTTEYDWRRTEAKLNNDMPQFETDITVDGFGTYAVHFVHQHSKVKSAIPLLFLHGWPGNFTEAQKILPLLMSGNGKDTPAFHVVSPSLIDYGFSDRSAKKGFNVTAHAQTYHKLMQKLGYEKYVVQGGDLGSFIARVMVQHYQSSIGGHLLNLATPRKPTAEQDPELYEKVQNTELSEEEKEGLKQHPHFASEGAGYHKLQSTKPQTIGYSMADSPMGLMTWILEKLHDWTDSYPWTEEEVLQWVCIYYFSKPGPNATQHIYYESTHTPHEKPGTNYSPVPLGISRFPKELTLLPKLWHETLGPLVFWSVHGNGGHFAAWEKPKELADYLRKMFGKEGPCAACCGKGRSGYEDEAVSKL